MMCEGDGGGERKMRTTSERKMRERGVKSTMTKANGCQL